MESLIKLKKNHPSPTIKTICKVLNEHVSALDTIIQENELRLVEDRRTFEDLSCQLSITQNKLDVYKKLFEEKSKELKTENEKLKDMETEKNRILKQNYTLERRCHKLRIIKPNARDQCILDLGQKKYGLYKQLTRIRWDFGALEEATKGLVTDKNSYIRTFCYPNDIGKDELSNLLWKEIQLSTEKKFHDEEGEKENVLSNK